MLQPKKPIVTVCIPAFQSGQFIEQTLNSIRKQTFKHFRVITSVDSKSDNTFNISRNFRGDKRFKAIQQPQPLGWVGNLNWILRKVDTPYFFFMSHDDLLHPNYIERHIEILEANPQAILSYSDMEWFGTQSNIEKGFDVKGNVEERLLTYLSHPVSSISSRGVTHTSSLRSGTHARDNNYQGYGTMPLWALEQLTQGEMVYFEEPVPLYKKRGHQNSVTSLRKNWDPLYSIRAIFTHLNEISKMLKERNVQELTILKIHHKALHRLMPEILERMWPWIEKDNPIYALQKITVAKSYFDLHGSLDEEFLKTDLNDVHTENKHTSEMFSILAQQAVNAGEKELGLGLAKKAFVCDQESIKSHFSMGIATMENRMYEKSLEMLQHCYNLQPTHQHAAALASVLQKLAEAETKTA